MRHRFQICVLLWLAAVSAFLSPRATFAQETVVKKIQLAELDKMISDKDCRCMIVAMAAWCAPCRKELPVLNKLFTQYKDRGLEMIGISIDPGGPEEIQPLITKSGVTFPVYWAGDDAVRKYKIFGIPMIFIIKNGEIVEKIPGERPEAYLERKIKTLLDEND